MNQAYNDLHHIADELHFKLGDHCSNHNDPLAQTIIRQGKQVVEEMEVDRHPRELESLILEIQNELQHLKSQPVSILTYNDIESLYHDYQKLREALRRLPNY